MADYIHVKMKFSKLEPVWFAELWRITARR